MTGDAEKEAFNAKIDDAIARIDADLAHLDTSEAVTAMIAYLGRFIGKQSIVGTGGKHPDVLYAVGGGVRTVAENISTYALDLVRDHDGGRGNAPTH